MAGAFTRWIAAALAALALAPAALAQTADESSDNQLLQRAFAAIGQGGYPALDPLLPALREALGRTPASYPVVQDLGDRILVRADLSDGLVEAAAAGAAERQAHPDRHVNIVVVPDVYPEIALLLTSEAVERRRYEEAVGFADRGLRMQPHHVLLVGERAAALQGLKRHDEALASIEAELALPDPVVALHRGLLLRKRGFSLVELGQLDAAQAAYEDSLKAEPGNATALRELQYIQGLRAGAPRGTGVFTAPASRPPATHPSPRPPPGPASPPVKISA